MRRTTISFIFALFPLLPVSSRTGYALIISIALVFYFAAGVLFREYVRWTQTGKPGLWIELTALAAAATLFLIFLSSLFPVIAISLSFYILLSSLSYILLVSIDRFTPGADDSNVTDRFLPLVTFIPFLLGFSVFRELIGFGTLSLPAAGGLRIFPILPYFNMYGVQFLGTSGGALVLLGMITWLVKYITRRIGNLRRSS